MVSSETSDAVDTPTRGRYQIDPARSEVRFRTRHLFGLAEVTGTVQVRSGELVVTDPPSASTVTAILDSGSFRTTNPRRDTDVRSARFLQVDDYPDITFEAAGPHRGGAGWTLPGRLTVRRETNPIELAVVSLQVVGEELRARATTRVDRFSFGLRRAKGMAARHLDIELAVTAQRS